MTAGRPTKYDPAYCEMLVAHMADGASVGSFAAEIDVARATINLWAEAHPEFMEALSRGKAKAQSWWERVGRNVAMTGEGNAPMAIFGMKNMGGDDWEDKTKRDVNHGVQDSLSQLLTEIDGRSKGLPNG